MSQAAAQLTRCRDSRLGWQPVSGQRRWTARENLR